uniref:Rap1 GTPase-GDP dissociation stimulator 1-like n=1 Tax=Serinus canaria TaxID=9135 RepID=A0A8C9U3C9_SERCA
CLETLNKHLEYLGLCGDDTEAEDQILESLNGILLAVTEDRSGIFPILAKILKGNPRCAVKAAHVLSEIAKNEEMKKPCIEADLVLTLIPLLESTDQEMLLHAGRAIGRICYDNRKHPLKRICFSLALRHYFKRHCNLQGKDSLNSEFASLCFLPLSPAWFWLSSDGNCLRLFQLGVIHQLLDLLEKHVRSGDTSVQQAALSALQSLAVPVVSKVQMLEEGVAERIEALLRSESPPVQFKLLGTLRTLADGQADAAELLGQDPLLLSRLVQWCSQSDHRGICGEANRLLASILHHNRSQEVVKAIQAAQGVKHLVSMTTSEHAAMQNEALNALAIASAIDLGIFLLKLIQSLHKLLRDDNTSPEVKYNSMGLLCRLLNSGNLILQDKIKDTLEQLCSHSNADVVKEAITTLQVLRGETPS